MTARGLEYVVTLHHLGLSEQAELVYQAMLNEPCADLTRIQRLTELDFAALVGALDELAELALVSWDARMQRAELVDPDSALLTLLAQRQSEIAGRQVALEATRLTVDRLLIARHAESGDSAEFERIIGLGAVRTKIEELSRTCEKSVWSFNPGGPQSLENLRHSRPLNKATLDRGVRMRAIYLNAVHNDEATIEHVTWLTNHGAEVRSAAVLPLRLLIVDGSVALLPIDDDDSSKGAVLVRSRGMVTAMVALFVSVWRTSQPFGPRIHRKPGELNEQERHALRLWAHGLTDQNVARLLGVSERTVRRMSESISDRLGARSRFQAGAMAMDAGLLTSEDLI